MPITPGKCPFTVVAGMTIPTCPTFTEKDCIEVFKVYDQCVAEEFLGACEDIGVACPGITVPPDATVTCTVVPGSAVCFFIGFGPFTTPFFRTVRVFNTVDVSVTISVGGTVICGPFTITLQGITQALLWAPDGTSVQCSVLAAGDCVCNLVTNALGVVTQVCCSAKVCKEIQVKALVKLLVPSYGFCELQPCVAAPQPEFPCPPEPLFPPQRCQFPPTVTILNVLGLGVAGVSVSIVRTTSSGPVTITHVTNGSGVATFPEIGGVECVIDTTQFADPFGSGKLVSFTPPCEFTDVNGVAHDSSTICSLVFQQTATPGFFTVFIDGFQFGTIDPK